jgi:hypothetical protein
MAGETNLARLLREMRPVLHPETHVFVALKPDEACPPAITPVMTFREREGVTLILTESEARVAGLEGTFASRMITLDVHSSLSAVGFLAEITRRLAAAGIPANTVSAYFHDHLFVPADHADQAMKLLQA